MPKKYQKIIFDHRINFKTTLLVILGVLLPVIPALKGIFSGGMPFWNDPARDMLAGLHNLKKPSLIGPPSGIPGIFYGPYWIWLTSLIQIFFKDPRAIVLISQVMPTAAIFCFAFYYLTRKIDKQLWIAFWWIFTSTYSNYLSYSWHPHLAPALLLVLFLLAAKVKSLTKSNYLNLYIIGIASGLLVNIHMSFGSGVLIGTTLYVVLSSIHQLRQTKAKRQKIGAAISNILFFIFGIITIFSPHILFELRHDFLQTKGLIANVKTAVINRENAINLEGINKSSLPLMFLDKGAEVFQISTANWRLILLILTLVVLIKLKQGKISLSDFEKRGLLFLCLISLSVLGFYSFSKNPVWQYHFIGLETVVLLLVSLLFIKLRLVRYLFVSWTAILFVLFIQKFYTDFYTNPLIMKSYASKKHSVDLIYQDTNGKPFAYFAFAANSYTFEYEYLFLWLSQKYHLPFPQEANQNLPIYLIIPEESIDLSLDFINYRTPRSDYLTEKTWYLPNGTMVLKRVARKL